jgi:hypothetical protein
LDRGNHAGVNPGRKPGEVFLRLTFQQYPMHRHLRLRPAR